MDSFWGSFVGILSWPSVGFLVGGTLLGLILGSYPGSWGNYDFSSPIAAYLHFGFPIFDRVDDRNHGGDYHE